MFDSREYLESLEPPQFIAADGTTFVGRVVSVDEWEPLKERMAAASGGTFDVKTLNALLRDLTYLFFPRGWRFWTKKFWRPAWWYVRRLPSLGQLQATWSFMRSQARALGQEEPLLTPGLRKLLDCNSEPSAAPRLAG